MKTIRDIKHFEGVRILVRVDFNVPIKNDIIVDDMRIRAVLATIDFLRSRNAKIILISHLESINGENLSLEPISKSLDRLNIPNIFIKDYKRVNDYIEHEMKDGECILLENLRFFAGEKDNNKKLAKELASLGDIFVNEAFSVSHREHASIIGIPKLLPSYVGLQFEKEVLNLSRAFNPSHPFLFVLGGAKFETKLPLLKKFMNIADMVFVGGALASDFFKAKGYEVGKSKISDGKFNISQFVNNSKLLLPIDVVNKSGEIKPAENLSSSDKIMDTGPRTLEMLKEKIATAKFILWNGPLGLYEDGFRDSTLELAKMIGEATMRGTETIVGGGDTLAAIKASSIQNGFTFISMGGGAMLEFLAKGTLPGIEALEDSAKNN